jgi:hypothetical protein
MRAFFADGVDKMHIPWAVEGLPALLHLSVFLFFGGLAIFLFNIDHAVFGSVIWWIGLFLIVYGLITVMPIVRHDSPYYSPLSRSSWFLYAGTKYAFLKFRESRSFESLQHLRELRNRYHGWMSGGVEKAAEDTVSERSSEIDIRIFDWTIGVLGEDESLEKFFEAIPGFFNSKLVKDLERDIPWRLFKMLWGTLDGFMDRTLSSNSVTESVKSHRVDICRDIMSMMPCPSYFIFDNLCPHFNQAPISIERLQVMARWTTNKDLFIAEWAQVVVAERLVRMQERDNNWIPLVIEICGLPEHVRQHNIALGGDNALLATLIDVSRRVSHQNIPLWPVWALVKALAQFDIHHTLPGLQHDFCIVWNEIVQEAMDQANQGPFGTPVRILREIRHLYIALHEGTDASSIAFSASTDDFDDILYRPSPYPLCNIASHRPDSTTRPNSRAVSLFTRPGGLPNASPDLPSRGSSAVPQQAELADIIAGPPSPSGPTTPGEIGDTSQAPAATPPAFPFHTTTHPTDPSPPGTVTALQVTPPAATLSHPLEGTTQRDIVASCAEPDIDESLSTASASCEPGVTPTSHPFLPASSISIPTSPAPSCPPPLPNPDLLASAPSTTEVAATSFACSDDPMPEIDSSVSGETSRAPVEHPVSVPATITPSTGPDPSDDPVALQSTLSSAYLSCLLEGNQQQDAVTPSTALVVSEVSSTVNHIPQATRTVSPTINTILSGSSTSLVLLPALSDGLTTAEPPSSVESAPLQLDQTLHVLRNPSSSLITASAPISPQAASGSEFDVQVSLSIGIPSSHDDTSHDINTHIPTTVPAYFYQTARPVDDIVTATLQPEGQAQAAQHDLEAS